MQKIIPAILEKTFDDIQQRVDSVRSIAPYVQIDIVDGVFAPIPTFPYAKEMSGGGAEEVSREGAEEASGEEVEGASEKEAEKGSELKDALKKLDSLSVQYELDLMVSKPEEILQHLLQTNASRLCIHFASTNQLAHCIEQIKQADKEVYIALTVEDALEDAAPFFSAIDGVQCMGIAKVGVQGQPYDSRVEDMIRGIRERVETLPISVDGAVSMDTATALLQAGATQLCVGSALFKSDDIAESYRNLQNINLPS